MKKLISLMLVFMTLLFVLVSCERVAPNYAGVLMENYGKQGKEDFKVVSGRVSTWDGGTELFQVPLFDQRGEFSAPNKLDTVFSRFIRLRDARKDGTFQCISCGRILPLDQADCGHYINRQHMSTRFSEKNCNAQCRSCNRFDEGNMQGYRRGLILKYGEPAVLLLESMKNQTNKISDFEYSTMIKYYQGEVKRLKEEKQIRQI